MIYEKRFKRIVDMVLSTVGIIILSPLFLLIALCIKIDSRGPVFFKQLRVGKDKQEFNIYKFRTMRIETPKDTPTFLLENPNKHITRMGKFLRKTSLDELPQIINIIKGEMSVIGPRPIIRKEEDLFFERDKVGVYTIKPGLTGLAQISGRDLVTFKEKAKLDGEYVGNISFLLDAKIFLLTITSVLKADGIHEGAQVVEKDQPKGKERLVR